MGSVVALTQHVSRARSTGIRTIAWVGLLGPAAFVEARAPELVVDDPFTLVTLLRGVGPGLCLVAAVVLARPRLRPVGHREWLLAGYLTVVVASTVWSLAPRATLLKAGHLVVAYALLVLLARHWRDREQAFRELALVVYAVVVLAAITAVAMPVRSRNEFTGRLVAVFPSLQAVTLGLFAAVALVLLMANAGPSWLVRKWFVRVALALTASAVLLLTGARTAVALAVVGAAVLAWSRGWTLRPRDVALAVTVVLGLVLSPLGQTLRDRLLGEQGQSVFDFGGRLPLWSLALEAVEERPLIGYGYFAGHRLGRYAELFYERIDPTQLPYVDGTWIETLLDLGLLGVGALLAFVVVSARLILQARDGTRSSSLQVCLLLVGVSYSIQDFTLQQVGYPLVLLGSVLLGPLRSAEADRLEDAAPG